MRSKEVEEAIEALIKLKDYKPFIITLADGRFYSKELTIDKVIEYIETLEKQMPTVDNCVPVEYQTLILVDKREAVMKDKIRDKIKELEEKYVELSKNKSSSEKAELNHEYIEKRSLLESLLGE